MADSRRGGNGLAFGRRKRADAAGCRANIAETGDFTGAGTALDIRSTSGKDVLHAAATGPLFYAELLPGRYVIHATNDGQHRTRDVTVAARQTTDIHLIWPQPG